MTRFFGLVTVRRKDDPKDEETEPEAGVIEEDARLEAVPELARLAAEELKRKTEMPVPETIWERAARLRAVGMREERIAADLGVLSSDLRLRWKLESLRGTTARGGRTGVATKS